MEVGGLNSQNESQNQASWIPMTPVKPILPGPRLIYEAAAAVAEGNMGVVNGNDNNRGSENDNVELLKKHVSFQELLLQAEAGVIPLLNPGPGPKEIDGAAESPVVCAGIERIQGNCGDSSSAARQFELQDKIPVPHQYPYDLNLTLGTTFSPLLEKSVPKFAPVTPEKSLIVDSKKVCEIQNLDVDDIRHQEREEQTNEIAMKMVNINVLNYDKDTPRLARDSLVAADSTALQDNQNPDMGDSHETDLNKTPQQKPRRKKHRPKVVIEGKPKTPKPVTPKAAADTRKNPTAKRKYVRKNGTHKALETPTDVAGQCNDFKTPTPSKKACRRALNFEEMKPTAGDSRYSSSNVGSESQVHHYCTRRVISKSTFQLYSGIEEVIVESTEAGSIHDTCSTHAMEDSYTAELETEALRTPVPIKTNSPLEKLNANIQEDNKDVQVSAPIQHENAAQILLDRNTRPWPTSPNDSDCSSTVNLIEGTEQAQDSKGNYRLAIKQADICSSNMAGAHYNRLQAYCLISWSHNKKKRTDKVQNSAASSITLCATTKDVGSELTVYPQNDTKVNPYGSEINNLMSPHSNCNEVSAAARQGRNSLQENPQTDEYFIMALSPNERPTKKRSRSATRARNLASLTRLAGNGMGMTYCITPAVVYNNKQRVENFHKPDTCIDALIAHTRATLARKRRSQKRNSSSVQKRGSQGGQQSYSNFSGAPQEVVFAELLSVEAIEKQLKCLDINRESIVSPYQERNAIVPFNARSQNHNALVLHRRDGGTIVPYKDSFDITKKLRPRPKVDLDEETNRVWKLLLGNINSEGIDGTDEDKAKWWEEERNVFRGRADSFIARMHLVQGDRRFSRWKGSVLDSVVGVFLTQNVSDHLSSSAFMSLAARFPLESKNHDKSCLLSDEPEVCISRSQPVCDWTLLTSHDAEHNKVTDVNRNATYRSNITDVEQDDEATTNLISLQHYANSSASQTCNKSGSCSESNSDAEGLPNISKQDNLDDSISFLEHLHKDKSFMLQEVCNGSGKTSSCNESKAMKHDDKRQNKDKASPRSSIGSSIDPANNHFCHDATNAEVSIIESDEIFREETLSSDISQNKTENSASNQSSLTVDSASQNTIQEKMKPTPQEATRCPGELCNKIQVEKNILVESQRMLVGNPKIVETLTQQNLPSHSDETQVVTEKATKSYLNEYGHSLIKESNELEVTATKLKSKRAGKEKKDNQDWDKLRQQTEANGRREKTENTMDSLDWEAVRCADVNEIADTIKERGMNNKLAERIKDFLNRLVKEHGSTDLEWLRDVPPDQAKEYLLSIRGLGLKSVECVRLLTLHHLAFPVDTNVGRIAVRLGWVPLQPLPESLQLHLLELYPVLESIQKYLWPRLCKLDQRTLYELHYQMITFGKVFCTKNKPNCNACPMRGECRHFASAFASARLALPGPEEKRVVIATERGKEDINQTVIKERTPLLLPPAAEQSEKDQPLKVSHQLEAIAGVNHYEPIIEEPATPEPDCTKTLEDIEDMFYEDSDEIPTIKLNIEEFSQNLQNYMQKNMELQDGDMSRALVALGPEAASIPMPKLKNVSRLRTEHQVYELPDSHPLLEKLQLEKREPDDPCSYLLAIWTPGETANSIEPPERCCSQGFDKLCNVKECFSCNSVREANSQTVRGTLLIPCRTAMRGSFPLNGTYFQVNEVFADHDSSVNPIDVPRAWIWNLQRRTVYFGTSIPTIFKGLTTQGIQHCFWRGFVCVRGFDRKTRAPRPLIARLHFPASKVKRTKDEKNE